MEPTASMSSSQIYRAAHDTARHATAALHHSVQIDRQTADKHTEAASRRAGSELRQANGMVGHEPHAAVTDYDSALAQLRATAAALRASSVSGRALVASRASSVASRRHSTEGTELPMSAALAAALGTDTPVYFDQHVSPPVADDLVSISTVSESAPGSVVWAQHAAAPAPAASTGSPSLAERTASPTRALLQPRGQASGTPNARLLTQQLDAAITARDIADASRSQLTVQLEALQAQLQAAEDQLSDQNGVIAALQQELRNTKAELNETQAQLGAAQTEKTSALEHAQAVTRTCSKSEAATNAMRTEFLQLQEELVQTRADLAKAKEGQRTSLRDLDVVLKVLTRLPAALQQSAERTAAAAKPATPASEEEQLPLMEAVSKQLAHLTQAIQGMVGQQPRPEHAAPARVHQAEARAGATARSSWPVRPQATAPASSSDPVPSHSPAPGAAPGPSLSVAHATAKLRQAIRRREYAAAGAEHAATWTASHPPRATTADLPTASHTEHQTMAAAWATPSAPVHDAARYATPASAAMEVPFYATSSSIPAGFSSPQPASQQPARPASATVRQDWSKAFIPRAVHQG